MPRFPDFPLATSAAPDELAALSRHPEVMVRTAVAQHPNTPEHVLGELGADHPEAVLRNPALPLLLLARGPQVSRWPASTYLALLGTPGVPPILLNLAARHSEPTVLERLAAQPALPDSVLEVLATNAAWTLRARTARRPELPTGLLERLAHDPDYGVRQAVAARNDLPAHLRAALEQDPHPLVRAAARHA